MDPDAKNIKITCAVVEEEERIESYQKEDAEKYKVLLRGAKRPRGLKKKPRIKWLDKNTGAYYLHLVRENSYDFIIGHIPYLAHGALNFRNLYTSPENKQPKVILMIHDLPKTKSGETDEDTLCEWLSESDVVFSVGKEVEAEIFFIHCIPTSRRPSSAQAIHSWVSFGTFRCPSYCSRGKQSSRHSKRNADDRRTKKLGD